MASLLGKLSPSIVDMIRDDHSAVIKIFHRYHLDTPAGAKQAMVDAICTALEIHAQLEEEIFYPALRAVAAIGPVLENSVPEHDAMRERIAQLRQMTPDDTGYDAVLMSLMREVMHHVADEESVLLPEAARLLKDQLHEMGAEMTKRRMELAGPRAGAMAYDMVRSRPVASALVAAGALLAGGYLIKRSGARHA